uniref:Glutathione transferase n=1 Tax=Macrostomum lignano TaxID=282301 RepID=A0A1I8F1X0_9PLAT
MSNQQQPANIIFESSKHLESGEPEPQLKPNLLTLYSMRFCPFAQRTRLVLQHKQLPHQIVNVNLVRKPDWFLAKSSSGQISSHLRLPGWTLIESLVTCDYLEDAHPEPPLYPGDARKRAAIRLAAQLGDTNFFGDCDQVQMADLMIWPWMERLPVAAKMLGFQLPADRFDKLLGWTSRMEQQRAVKETHISDDVHAAFFKAYWAKETNVPLLASRSRSSSPTCSPVLHAVLPVRQQRTRLVLQHKQLPHQIVNLNLVRKPDWFLAKSASGKVPALLEPDGSVLEDSLVTSRHLEEAQRESALYPSNADKRAQMDGVIAQMGEKVIPAFYKLFGVSGDEKKAAFEQLVTELESMQSALGDSKFFAGSESVQMADLMIWPWFERPEAFVPEERLKSLMSWMGRMEQQRAVLETRNTDEAHVEFTRSLLANQPKYDGY